MKVVLFLFLGGLVVVGVFGIMYTLLFSPFTQIQEIRVKRTDPRIDIEVVQVALAPLFGTHITLLQEQDVFDLLQSAVPDLSSVHISKHYPSYVSVQLELEPLVAQIHTLEEDGKESTPAEGTGAVLRGYITEKGTYAEYVTLQVKDHAALPHIAVTDWGVRPQPGTQLVRPAFLERLWKAEELLEEQFGQKTEQRILFLRAREFHLDVGPMVWFDDRGALEEQLKRYQVFLQSVSLEQVQEYIDLRLSDRVVYK